MPEGYENYISKEFHEIHEGLEKHGWRKLTLSESNDEEILASLKWADAILFFEAYDFILKNAKALLENDELSESTKYFFCDDIHFFTNGFREKRLKSFEAVDTIFATYPVQLLELYPEVAPYKVKWTPHAASSYFNPTFTPSKNKVLLSGSRSWIYPFRQFCAEMISDDVRDVVDHPGYPAYPGNKNITDSSNQALMKSHGQEHYVSLLNDYPAMYASGSVLKYLVAKVFESMASGCLVICDRPSLAKSLDSLGFKEGIHYSGTDIFHARSDSEKLLNMYQSKNGEWLSIVKSAHEKVSSAHTTALRAGQIDDFVMHRLNGEKIDNCFIEMISLQY